MYPLQAEILRVLSQLGDRHQFNSAGSIAHFTTDEVPQLFLQMEFWPLVRRGPLGADKNLDRALKNLERNKYLEHKKSSLWFPQLRQPFIYTTLSGAKWHVETRASYWRPIPTVDYEISREVVIAAPVGCVDEYLRTMPERLYWNTCIFIKPVGICVRCEDHPHYALTEMGWDDPCLAELGRNSALGNSIATAPGAASGDQLGGSLAGFESADTLAIRHGIKAERLSEAKKNGRVKWKPAPDGMPRDSQGKAVRILYNEKDALKHCLPKQAKLKTRKVAIRKP